jgi:hypothetical protein
MSIPGGLAPDSDTQPANDRNAPPPVDAAVSTLAPTQVESPHNATPPSEPQRESRASPDLIPQAKRSRGASEAVADVLQPEFKADPVVQKTVADDESHYCRAGHAVLLLFVACAIWIYLLVIFIVGAATPIQCEFGLSYWPLAALAPLPIWIKGYCFSGYIELGREFIRLAQLSLVGVLAYGVQIFRVFAYEPEDRTCPTWFLYSVLVCLVLYFVALYIWLAVIMSSHLCCTMHGKCPNRRWYGRCHCGASIWNEICGANYRDSNYYN